MEERKRGEREKEEGKWKKNGKESRIVGCETEGLNVFDVLEYLGGYDIVGYIRYRTDERYLNYPSCQHPCR
jgi:hypothetical protein